MTKSWYIQGLIGNDVRIFDGGEPRVSWDVGDLIRLFGEKDCDITFSMHYFHDDQGWDNFLGHVQSIHIIR